MPVAPLLRALPLLLLLPLTAPPAAGAAPLAGPVAMSAEAAHAYRGRVQRDAYRYVQRLDRIVGLTRRQEAFVFDVLMRNTVRAARYQGRRAVYPFPRRAAEQVRPGRRFWDRTDAQIVRVLSGRQRRAYHRFLYGRAAYDRRWDRYERRYERRWDDDRWDDDRWDDDRWDDDRWEDRRDDRRRGRGRGGD